MTADSAPKPTPPTEPSDDYHERISRALGGDIPQLYANAFVNSLTSADVVTVLERNGAPVAVLNMSFTTAKTLARALAQVIAQLEEHTKRDMLTTLDVDAMLNVSREE